MIEAQLDPTLEQRIGPATSDRRPSAPPAFQAPRGVRYLPVLAILLVQAALSLRLNNTAFADEALYITAGHAELSHLLHGTPVQNYATNFSGSPFIYPPLAGMLDSLGGLALVRLVSLLFMLVTTVLVFSTARRLFGYGAGLLAAVVFMAGPPTLFLGHFATFDPMAVMLLALAGYLVVLGADRGGGLGELLGACGGVVVAVAALTKYAGFLFVPTVIGLAYLAGVRRVGWLRALTSHLLPTLVAAVGTTVMIVSLNPGVLSGLGVTTTKRAVGATPVFAILRQSALDVGGAVLLGLVGAAIEFVRRAPWDRRLLAVGLVASALLAPAYQLHLHTDVSLQKHTGYGLVFVAPVAGRGLAQLFGRLRRQMVAPFVLIAIALLSLAANTSLTLFSAWPNTNQLVSVLRPRVSADPTGRYLVENASVVEYYLADKTHPWQWDSTYYLQYPGGAGLDPTSAAMFEDAIRHAYFQVIALSDGSTRALDLKLQAVLRHDTRYKLIAEFKYDTSFGGGKWLVWQRV